jgi:hypothetical protein
LALGQIAGAINRDHLQQYEVRALDIERAIFAAINRE